MAEKIEHKTLDIVICNAVSPKRDVTFAMCDIINRAWKQDHPDEDENVSYRRVPINGAIQEALQPLKDHLDAIPDIAGQAALAIYDALKDNPCFQPNKRRQRERELATVIREEKEKYKAEIERNVRRRLNLPDSHELFVFDTCEDD